MVALDKRRNYIVATASNFFGATNSSLKLESEELLLLNKFLDESKCKTLCAVHLLDSEFKETRVKLTNRLSSDDNTLVFYKVSFSTILSKKLINVNETKEKIY